jgi:hypothetical protein
MGDLPDDPILVLSATFPHPDGPIRVSAPFSFWLDQEAVRAMAVAFGFRPTGPPIPETDWLQLLGRVLDEPREAA